ncbi:hypothetical protein [Labrys sp. 22185]|uniref:hypothetical protein n=1 Tax=Labrys sp. 22185 TaxID=3453888 RepID=UPI003F84BCE2
MALRLRFPIVALAMLLGACNSGSSDSELSGPAPTFGSPEALLSTESARQTSSPVVIPPAIENDPITMLRPGIVESLPLRDYVKPIDWGFLNYYSGDKTGVDESGARVRKILANSARYLIGPAYASKYTSYAPDGYLDLGGVNEAAIRYPAMAAVTVAIALKTGVYDPKNLSADKATARTTNLVRTIAARHKANNANSGTAWGYEWQSALWTYYGSFAAWVVWDQLSTDDKDKVVKMMVAEAERLLSGNDVYLIGTSGQQLYMTRRDGTVVTPGDSKIEEDQWNAALLGLAVAMMPNHPKAEFWKSRHKQLLLAATARPADLSDAVIVNGLRPSIWLQGTNLTDDGVVYNHDILHPVYMLIDQGLYEAVSAALGGKCAPVSATRNVSLIYKALVDKKYPVGTGTKTIYEPGSAVINYPQGNDWGTEFPGYFGGFDQLISLFGLDKDTTVPASIWEKLHNERQLMLQDRSTDGRTYVAPNENTYGGREQRIGVIYGLTYLATSLVKNNAGTKTCWYNN